MVLLRLLSRSAWWAIVNVTPEVNNNAVLMVGNQKGPIVINGSTIPAGEAVAPVAKAASKPVTVVPFYLNIEEIEKLISEANKIA